MNILVKSGEATATTTDVLVCLEYEQDKVWSKAVRPVDQKLGGQLSALRKSGEFSGKPNNTALLHIDGKLPAKRVLLVGLGTRETVTLERIRQAMGTAAKRARTAKAKGIVCVMPDVPKGTGPMDDVAQAMVEGVVLGEYRFNEYRTDRTDDTHSLQSCTLLTKSNAHLNEAKAGANRGKILGEATCFVRDLCNHPANVMTPSRVVTEAKNIAREAKVRLKVLDRKQQEKLGMGGLLGVSRGSIEPPQFIILEYMGGPRTQKPIVFVGKTVTFDSGGISLKPSENMEQMKADMTGGAEVLATIRAASRLKLPVNAIGLLPVTENMPGGRATKPGDILTMLSGKTVEVQNTDAEGRLILADGLAYASRLKPACVIDIATLTGAAAVALGQFAIGMLGNDDTMKADLKKAGNQAGERVWEMPLWDEYFEQLKSDVADMRNIGGRGGGMITAAMFLSKFVGDHPWVHLDIASTDWGTTERPYTPKGPTGIGTRLLIQYLLNHVNR
ncbi:leucyl aminopeptidase [Nitrospira sp. T9]|uniref:leucyl aminopeptidase n=1 Tax=unclassified Nitrospira TaxID=2652172 RepID=UPI003F9DD55E